VVATIVWVVIPQGTLPANGANPADLITLMHWAELGGSEPPEAIVLNTIVTDAPLPCTCARSLKTSNVSQFKSGIRIGYIQ
jgi:hypothetical protein